MVRAVWVMIFCSALSIADMIDLGVVSFNVLIPGDVGAPGVNYFNVLNLTGDPAGGGSALPPDFPAFTPLTFMSSTLTVVKGASQVIDLGDLGPGTLPATSAVEFSEIDQFRSAAFTSLLNETNLLLADGRTFVLDSPSLTATLLPSSGDVLTAEVDFAILRASGSFVVDPIPEPGSFTLLTTALAVCGAAFKLRRSS